MRRRWRRRRDLVERLRPYLPERITPEPMVDADPIRMFLYRWMIETGDPIGLVGRGFDTDPRILGSILDRTTRALPRSDWDEIAYKLGIHRHAKP